MQADGEQDKIRNILSTVLLLQNLNFYPEHFVLFDRGASVFPLQLDLVLLSCRHRCYSYAA
jgi:hypothetical protein